MMIPLRRLGESSDLNKPLRKCKNPQSCTLFAFETFDIRNKDIF